MQRPDLSGLRHRTPVTTWSTGIPYTKGVSVGTQFKWQGAPVVTSEHSTSMYDVVVENYKERSANGEVFFNRMYKETREFLYPLLTVTYNDPSNSFTGKLQYPVPPAKLNPFATNKYDYLIDNAITDAYANASSQEDNVLLWLGELRECFNMLVDIGGKIVRLYQMTARQRKLWAKGLLSVEQAQSLTLQLLYGILPIEQQITAFLEGLMKIRAAGRFSARGYQQTVDTVSDTFIYRGDLSYDGAVRSRYRLDMQEDVSINVRATVLCDFQPEKAPFLSVLLDPRSIVETAYALARLSFVVDWFINAGNTLKAWTPSAGVSVLGACYTVEVKHTYSGEYSGLNIPYFYNCSGGFREIRTYKWRQPITRAYLKVIPPVNFNLNVDKLNALILLFAKSKRD